MTDLTTTHLKRLLDQATPGPWEYDPGEAPDERCIIDVETWNMCINPTPNGEGSSCSDYDLELAAAAPQLAQEVLRMRKELTDLQEEARYAAKFLETGPAAQRVFDALETTINQILGETND
nr:MAG TPA: Ead/Ea22-like protein [Caudoviricetes sp.]